MVIGARKLREQGKLTDFSQEAGLDMSDGKVVYSCGAIKVAVDKDVADTLIAEGFFDDLEKTKKTKKCTSVETTIDKTNSR